MAQARLLRVSDGFPGSVHDLTISRRSGLADLLKRRGETAIGDRAYNGSRAFVAPYKRARNVPLTQAQKEFNNLLESYRHSVERFNSRLKIFQCVRQEWRHPLHKLTATFQVVSFIVNLSFIHRPLDEEWERVQLRESESDSEEGEVSEDSEDEEE